jgi:peptidoglycan/xylan/chitin deacetylase (PgdA/CDA1 family)
MKELTIVMYHYVRPIAESKFPDIKGLELDGFIRQLDYLEDNFTIVSVEDILDSVLKNKLLPSDACWLTFDDGYKDHFKYVLPELKKRQLQGAFFPPAFPVLKDKVLDVNAIHHILAKCSDISALRMSLDKLCLEASITDAELEVFWKKYAVANRFDDDVTIYIKRMLQHVLPERTRNIITQKLFEEYVGIPIEDFSHELYMSVSEVCKLVSEGMYVGSHGSKHYWLDRMSEKEQRVDIEDSLKFLEEVGAPSKDWVMCYPFGSYNSETLSVLHDLGAKIGVTTEVRKANLAKDNPLILPRLDTNDYPQ